ncbi:MAG: chemotaxis protein CheW [Gemmatimonadaceae bacterium]|nr:chemotaxis protein CheW [Gemmatimonadaceae bacterium]
MDDLLRDFLTESAENLQQLDQDLVELEQRSDDPTLINRIFRAIHTIKGTCGFIGLDRLERVAHAAESVLDAVRANELGVSDALITDVLAAIDVIKAILDALEQTQAEPAGDDSVLIARLEAWLTGDAAPSAPEPSSLPEGSPVPEPTRKGKKAKSAKVAERPSAKVVEHPSAKAAAARSEERPSAKVAAKKPAAPRAPDAPVAESADASVEVRSSLAESSLRVNVDLLDRLMTLVGELVLDRNRLLQLTAQREDTAAASAVQHLNRVTSDLQDAVMRTRMQPIGGAWTKLPRLVRDLAQMSGKQLKLEQHGAETELDRQILQAIGDPLTHMIRNSADHGIESPEVRVAAGKPAHGTISLTAFHEGGHVIIEVRDDGAGVSVDKVREKAISRGLVTREAASAMGEAQILRYIFEPGFSTAEKVTNVSGRGVGMDVVRTNIERIGGSVSIESEFGKGSVVRTKIPLTLAIIPALVVTAAGQRYAIPQVSLLELVRVSGVAGEPAVEHLHGAPVYRLRGRLLPLVFLDGLLGSGVEQSLEGRVLNIVVLKAEGRTFGLVVDGLRDTEEIVVKPLGRHLQSTGAYAGATIMGDGSVSLILDVPGLARHARVVDDRAVRDAQTRADEENAAKGDQRTLLVVQVGERDRAAVELARVSRLEELAADQVEFSNGGQVAQYRGEIIPLISLSEWFGHKAVDVAARGKIPVVIHRHGGRTVGLIVDRIIDIVEQELDVQRGRGGRGLVGTASVQGRVTDLLDLDHIVGSQVGEVRRPTPVVLEAVA